MNKRMPVKYQCATMLYKIEINLLDPMDQLDQESHELLESLESLKETKIKQFTLNFVKSKCTRIQKSQQSVTAKRLNDCAITENSKQIYVYSKSLFYFWIHKSVPLYRSELSWGKR